MTNKHFYNSFVIGRVVRLFLLVIAIVFFVFLGTQNASAAMSASNGAALKIHDGAAMFLIQFELGSTNGDMLVPATTKRTVSDELDSAYLHYYIDDQTGDTVEDGSAAAILLSSDAPLDGAQYRIPQGETATFTFFALFVTEEEDPAFRARMRTLPFHIDEHLMNQQYNRHELEKFVSGSVGLNID